MIKVSSNDLKESLRKRLSKYPQDKPLLLTTRRKFTPADIMQEIESGTETGQRFLANEQAYQERLKKSGRNVS